MSTYLNAFVISDFPYRMNTNEFKHRVFARPSQIETTYLALRDGERLLQVIPQYLNISYSMPKMDQIAIPNFKAGGKKRFNTNNLRYNLNPILFFSYGELG